MPRKKVNQENETIQDIKPIEKTTQEAPVEHSGSAAVKKSAAKAEKATPKKEEKKVEEIVKEITKEKAGKGTGRKAAGSKAAKKEIKVSATLQFSGKSYTEDDLVKIARDVWRYDLKRKLNELQSIELYVKPEENKVYYVINKTEEGSFNI